MRRGVAAKEDRGRQVRWNRGTLAYGHQNECKHAGITNNTGEHSEQCWLHVSGYYPCQKIEL